MISPDLRNRYRFFSEWAGYVVGRRAEGALSLARAEIEAEARDLSAEWVYDSDADLSWADSETVERLNSGGLQCLGCIARDPETEEEDSLWGIVVGSSTEPYARVVEAELWSELFARIRKEEAERMFWASRDVATVEAGR